MPLSCSGGLRPLFELCVEPTGVSGRCTGVSVPLRVVSSPTGLPSKRVRATGSSQEWTGKSRLIGMWHHPRGSSRISSCGRPHPEMRREGGNPFQTTQGNRHSCRHQEGRRGSEEAVPGASVFPSGEPGVSGNFWGSHERCLVLFRTSDGNWDFP